jgi:transcriptional regulator with XRE-family HTH domain
MTTKLVRSDGTNPKPAYAHVGLEKRPDGTDEPDPAPSHGVNPHRVVAPVGPTTESPDRPNGSDGGRARAHVGPTVDPNRSETVSHGVNGAPVSAPVRPRLDGNTDTRGLVSEEEREHLQPFGAELRTMRKAAGLTQAQLGKLAGIGTTHISRLEHGRRRPSVDAIKALARILAPAGATDAAEQRLASLAGDSLREGTARRKRRIDNKHRREAAAEFTKAQTKMRRLIAQKERRGEPVPDILRSLAGHDLSGRLGAVEDEPGITGIEPARSARDAREEIRDLIKSVKRRR